MNRMEFIGQTHQGSVVPIDDIINYFDHIMTAYDVTESMENISIGKIQDNLYSSLKINISSQNQSDLDNLVKNINENLHNRKNTYGRNFTVIANKLESSVELSIQEQNTL